MRPGRLHFMGRCVSGLLGLWGAAVTLGPRLAAAEALPTDTSFQEWVTRYARFSGNAVARWWSVDLDGNGEPDRVAILCSTGGTDYLATLLIQSDTGAAFRAPWPLDVHNEDLCLPGERKQWPVLPAACAPDNDGSELVKQLEAEVRGVFDQAALPTEPAGSDSCSPLPPFEQLPKRQALPALDKGGKSGRSQRTVGLRGGVPVIVASAAQTRRRPGVTAYHGHANFDDLIVQEAGAKPEHLVPLSKTGSELVYTAIGKKTGTRLQVGARKEGGSLS